MKVYSFVVESFMCTESDNGNEYFLAEGKVNHDYLLSCKRLEKWSLVSIFRRLLEIKSLDFTCHDKCSKSTES